MTEHKHTLTRDDFVRVALEFVNQHDISELTIRAIGKELGVDATALYRHFPKKESLLDAMLEAVLSEVGLKPDLDGASPRKAIVDIVSNVRQAFHCNPQLSAAYVSATGDFPSGLMLTRRISTHLVAMGLTGDNVVRTYQMIEGYTLGTSLFDSGGSPATWIIRQARYRYVNMPQFDAVATDPDHVRQIADDGFIRAINIIIDDALSQPTQ
jgi:AcrR family transcriptional regulator